MKQLTDEQYLAIGREVGRVWANAGYTEDCGALDMGRAAYAASFPHAVAEALETPDSEDFSACYEAAMRMPSAEGNFKGGWRACLRFYGARLARLTAKPDAAVEAVTELLVGARKSGREFSATELVAAVDAARAKEPRS